jgi:tetratricopeptide (TPR) repeat protein
VADVPAGIHLCSGTAKHSWVDLDDALKCCNGYVRDKRVTRDDHGNARLEFYWRPVGKDEPAETEEVPDIVPAPAFSTIEAEASEAEPPAGGLSHGAFFRRVAEIADDTSPNWRALTAGLLTLRLIDRWTVRHTTGRLPTLKEFVLVRRAIDEVDDDRVHEVLLKMTDAMREFSTDDVGSIPKLLFAYALLLEDASEWLLAIDVYETLLEQVHRPEEHDGIPLVYMRLGMSHRQLGHTSLAGAIYQRGLRVARMLSDSLGVLRIRVCEADLAIDRGDYQTASDILDEVIADARTDREAERETRARACYERAGIAMRAKQHELAALLLYDAYDQFGDVKSQVDALTQLAAALSALGARAGARNALHLLYDLTEQADIRLDAAINLLRLAGEDGNVEAFEEWRDAIEAGPLGIRLKALFYYRLGEGYQRLGQPQTASLAYRVLVMVARDNKLADYVLRAEAGLRGDPPAPTPQMGQVPPAITTVLERLDALKRSSVIISLPAD